VWGGGERLTGGVEAEDAVAFCLQVEWGGRGNTTPIEPHPHPNPQPHPRPSSCSMRHSGRRACSRMTHPPTTARLAGASAASVSSQGGGPGCQGPSQLFGPGRRVSSQALPLLLRPRGSPQQASAGAPFSTPRFSRPVFHAPFFTPAHSPAAAARAGPNRPRHRDAAAGLHHQRRRERRLVPPPPLRLAARCDCEAPARPGAPRGAPPAAAGCVRRCSCTRCPPRLPLRCADTHLPSPPPSSPPPGYDRSALEQSSCVSLPAVPPVTASGASCSSAATAPPGALPPARRVLSSEAAPCGGGGGGGAAATVGGSAAGNGQLVAAASVHAQRSRLADLIRLGPAGGGERALFNGLRVRWAAAERESVAASAFKRAHALSSNPKPSGGLAPRPGASPRPLDQPQPRPPLG
jgi:hypothetical protein